MCLILFAHKATPGYQLIVAANRDEFFSRPTQEASFWSTERNGEQLLAGRDLQAGGTWLGINRKGRFAAVTNWRDPSLSEQKPCSRGELAVNFLQSSLSALDFAESLQQSLDSYAGFNLLLRDQDTAIYVNNTGSVLRPLEPGIYGLSNGALNSSWPKVEQGRKGLAALIEQPQSISTDALIRMMGDQQQARDSALPNTGITLARERELSAAFISKPDGNYGTRNSTAVIIENNGRMRFCEQNFDSSGYPGSAHFHDFMQPCAGNRKTRAGGAVVTEVVSATES